MASPLKPWERNRVAGTTTLSSMPDLASAPAATATTTTVDGAAPAIPPIPTSLTASVNQNAAAYSRFGTATPSMASPYGGTGYGAAYGAGYGSSYGTGYTPYRYGGMGGYGGGMSGYGSGMYGGGGMYGGYGGMYGAGAGGPNDPNSLTNRFNTSTQATFQMLEGVVGAFGGFAQMLESTYMATHSSFFAMVSVAEQFGNLRDTLGSILGIFTLMRWLRTLLAKLTGRPLPADAAALTPAAFARFEGRAMPGGVGGAGASGPQPPKPSRKPLLFFVLAAFGLPYLMSKAIRTLAASQEEEEQRQMALQQQQHELQQQVLDPSKLEFCRVLYDYTPDPALVAQQKQQQQLLQAQAGAGLDVAVRRDDLVVVIRKTDPAGNASDWWLCRTRDGRMGYLPSTFLRQIASPGQQQQQPQQRLAALPASAAPASVSTARTVQTVVSAPASIAGSVAGSVASAGATTSDPVLAEKAAAKKMAEKAATVDAFMRSAVEQS